MRIRLCLLVSLVPTAACSGSSEVGSTTAALCDCNENPDLCCCSSPILIDVAGNGFELTSLNDGVKVATRAGYQQTERAWSKPGSDDAWLVLDRNGDGVINDMSEMFGNTTPQPQPREGQPRNGFLALTVYDANGDGVIDERDPIFGSLRLWQDENHDGISQPDELHPLPELGVAGISVTFTEARHGDDHGNLFRYAASVYGTPGSPVGKQAWDVWLSGVQSMPIPDAPAQGASSPAVGSKVPDSDYWVCNSTCSSVPKACANVVAADASAPGDDPDPVGVLAVSACHAKIPDPDYCTFSPEADDVLLCFTTTGEFDVTTCVASCAGVRNDQPDGCGGPWYGGAVAWDWGAAIRNSISGCIEGATSYGFCQLAVNPADTIYDNPDEVIDNVITTCRFHQGTGGGGGGGGGGGCP
jgi:hypothetical protein